MSIINDKYTTLELIIPDDASGERLDKYLATHPGVNLTRTKIQKLIESEKISIDGQPAGHNHKLEGGEKVIINIPAPEDIQIAPENIPLDIRYEDEYLLVINKPPGMVTHPATGNFSGTLVNALLYHVEKLSQPEGKERAGIVHRLDKNTSGLLIAAKDDNTHARLQEMLKEHQIKKTYWAVICGHVSEDSGIIELPIGRSFKDRKKMAVTNVKGRSSRTAYKLLERYKLYDLLEVDLQTGRTHQIRVHFAHLGHPVLGDSEYGGRQKWHKGVVSYDRAMAQKTLKLIDRQALHAIRLEFVHPVTSGKIAVDSELPEDFAELLEFLRESEK